jgi:hypothetical protein
LTPLLDFAKLSCLDYHLSLDGSDFLRVLSNLRLLFGLNSFKHSTFLVPLYELSIHQAELLLSVRVVSQDSLVLRLEIAMRTVHVV